MTGIEEPPLDQIQVQALGVTGAKVVALRGFLVRLVAFVGNLVLARMLSPHDFGLVAMGFTLMALAMFLADGGLGAALIRRVAPPTRAELESLLGLQLVLTLLAVGITAAVAPAFGRAGAVALVMVASLPIVSFQAPGAILLERRLRYGPRVIVEIAEAVVYVVSAILLVALGAGVWGLAIATLGRAFAGAAVMTVVAPVRVVRPRLQLASVRGLVSFGARYQAVGVVNLVRDQGINLAVVAVGGLTSLGLWNLAYRVMQLPYLLFESLWRVSFPTIARLHASGHDVRPTVRRLLALMSIASGFILAGFVGASPFLVGTLFGETWQPASAVLPLACAGLMLGGPVSVAAAGYLYAMGDTSSILRAAVVHTIAWLAVTLSLLPSLGFIAAAWGWLASGIVEALMIGRALQRSSGISVIRLVWRPTLIAFGAAIAGMSAALTLPAGLLSVLVGGILAEILFLVGVLIFDRDSLKRLLSFTVRVARK